MRGAVIKACEVEAVASVLEILFLLSSTDQAPAYPLSVADAEAAIAQNSFQDPRELEAQLSTFGERDTLSHC